MELEEEVIGEVKNAYRLVSSEQEQNIVTLLVKKWREKPEKKVAVYLPPCKIEYFPGIYTFGVLGVDWIGMLEGITEMIHYAGWNICFHKGFIISYELKKLAIFIISIEIQSEAEFERFEKEKKKTRERIETIVKGGWAEKFLLAREFKKIEKLEDTMMEMKMEKSGKPLKQELVKETARFFAGRTEEYLTERSPKHLANQILTNHKFINNVRKLGGIPMLKVYHFKTVREKLTGITVGGFERDFSLSDCLDAVEDAVLNCVVKYTKQFTTEDGVAIYQIELDGFQDLRRIRKFMNDMIKGKRFGRQDMLESIGGVEQYARMVIPVLLNEFRVSSIPQVYISPVFSTKGLVNFKVIIIHSKEEGSTVALIDKFTATDGLSVISAPSPKLYGNIQVDMIDLEAKRALFDEQEMIYGIIKNKIKSVMGSFRDFDEGMRREDTKRLKEISGMLKTYPKELVRTVYYNLEDFYRISSPQEEIVWLIRLCLRLYRRSFKFRKKICVSSYNLKSSTLLCVASRKNLLKDILKLVLDYKPVVSNIIIGDINVHLFRLEKEGGAIPENEIALITKKIKNEKLL